MPRNARRTLGDGVYHATARGVAGLPIVRDDFDRLAILGLLDRVAARFGWVCHAFCLMSNHYHLVLATDVTGLARGMHRLNGVYAQRFNRRYDRNGHLFQNRYDARLIEAEEAFEAACRYVADNPVRAGLCDRPEDWPWSWIAV